MTSLPVKKRSHCSVFISCAHFDSTAHEYNVWCNEYIRSMIYNRTSLNLIDNSNLQYYLFFIPFAHFIHFYYIGTIFVCQAIVGITFTDIEHDDHLCYDFIAVQFYSRFVGIAFEMILFQWPLMTVVFKR